jgi:hypothetical protein
MGNDILLYWQQHNSVLHIILLKYYITVPSNSCTGGKKSHESF